MKNTQRKNNEMKNTIIATKMECEFATIKQLIDHPDRKAFFEKYKRQLENYR